MEGGTSAGDDLRALIADLRGFEGKKAILKELRSALRKPLPQARAAIRAAATSLLPHRNGLGAWVAGSKITASVRTGARTAGITLRGGRNSKGGRSDIRAIDRGRVRAPAWGNRRAWHSQTVPSGFFTRTVTEDLAPAWRQATIDAVNVATEALRGR